MSFSNDRIQRCLVVAEQMYNKALTESGNKQYANEMFHLGLVHDIGYQFTENATEHAFIGGIALKNENYKYWEEVYKHGEPNIINPSKELLLLNWADMHTDAKGNIVSFDERINDIGTRYGFTSIQYKAAKEMIKFLEENGLRE